MNAVEVIATGPPETMPALVDSLINERLIACGQLAAITSTFRWKGAVEESNELRATMHTTKARAEAVVQRIREAHPYEVPCILVIPILTGDGDYLAWVDQETQPPPASRVG